MLLDGAVWAQGITVDGRLSPARTLAGPNYAIGPELGRQVGGNLFHSFGAFGLTQGESATFSGPASVGNVIGRVTGGAASSIDGRVSSSIPGASLYLVNPAGVVFGPNARVDVSGSFHASSADYLRLSDGARFQATNPDASTLSAAPPEAFGFLSANPRPVTVDRSTLQLPPGRTLGVVGGVVTIGGGTLAAPMGTVHVASAAGPGEVPVDPRAGPPPTVARSGRVQVANNSTIIASGGNGSVFIRGGELSVSASSIVADNSGPGPGGVLSLHGDRAVTVSNAAAVRTAGNGTGRGPGISIATSAGGTVTVDSATVSTTATGTGDGGAVSISTGALTMQNGGLVLSGTTGSGNGGPISVTADSMLLDGLGTRLASQTNGTGLVDANGNPAPAGAGGAISLTGGTLSVQNRASVEAASFGSGVGGSIGIAMTGDVRVAGGSQILSSSNAAGAPGPAAAAKGGNAGPIALSAGALTLSRGGSIRSAALASGNAGQVALAVGGALTIDGTDKGEFLNGVSSEAVLRVSGSAGEVRVNAGSVTILNGGFINGNTGSTGAGGPVLVATPGALLLDGQGTGFTEIGASALGPQSGPAGTVTVSAGTVTVRGGAQIASSTAGSGRGGDIAVSTGALTLARGGSIVSNTSASGNGGEIALNVGGALTIDGTDRGDFVNGVSSEAAVNVPGSAGGVRVNAGSVSVVNRGFINSNTRGSGTGGSVLVTTPGTLLLDGRGAGFTEIAASALGRASDLAGTVTVSAGTLTVQGGAQIASSTAGPGRGGDVGVTAGSDIRLSGPGPQISAVSFGTGNAGSITVSAPRLSLRDGAAISTQTQVANGGSITIGPGDLLYLQRSAVTTSVGGASGNGGNITVDPRFVVLDRSVIQANAVGGNGGDVLVRAEQLVQSPDSAITASSQLGVSGQIFIGAQPLNLNGSLVVLASELRAAAALLRQGCAARGASPRSSLVVAGRGGQRQGLEATLPALYFAGRPVRDGGEPPSDASTPPARISLGLSSPCG